MPDNADFSQITQALRQWYARAQRDLPWRRSRDPYAIWVSEVMLQQTQVKTVIPYYRRFLERFPTVTALAQADLQQVLKAWEGLGYYSRARHLHLAAVIVSEDHDAKIPDSWDALHRLPGIGDYMAAALLSIAYHQPFAVVDGNVKRVLARVFALSEPVNGPQSHRFFQSWADRLLDRNHPALFNQAVMELGALVCLPHRPDCDRCPLAAFCRAKTAGTIDRYPQRIKRAPVPKKELMAAVIWKDDRLLLVKRPARGMLGGLWELPGAAPEPGVVPEEACRRMVAVETGLAVTVLEQIAVVNHAYTHLKIHLTVFACRWQKGRVRLSNAAGFEWIRPENVRSFPLHKAMAKVWPSIRMPV